MRSAPFPARSVAHVETESAFEPRRSADGADPSEADSLKLQFLIERHSDAYKVLGAGNGTGAITLAAALHYFSSAPDTALWIKIASLIFFAGVITFAFAYLLLVHFISNVTMFQTYLSYRTEERQPALETMISAQKKQSLDAIARSLRIAMASTLCFFSGCAVAVICLLRL